MISPNLLFMRDKLSWALVREDLIRLKIYKVYRTHDLFLSK